METTQMRIGDFLSPRAGKYKPDDAALANLARVDKIDFSGNFHISRRPSNTDMILICPGDLVISGIGVANGSLGVYSGSDNIAATIHYSSYEVDTSVIDIEYFRRFLKSAEFMQAMKEQTKRGLRSEIKPKHLLPLTVRLPSLAQQKQTAKRLAKTEDRIVALNAEIAGQKTLLEKLRRQLLQEAVLGNLTQKWRQQNPQVESAANQIKRMQGKIGALIADKTIKARPVRPVGNEEKPHSLPANWAWCRLSEIAHINPRNAVADDTDVGFTPMPLMKTGLFQTPLFEVRKWQAVKSGFTHFANGDVVVAKITPCFENSKSAVIRGFPNGIGAGTTELHVIRAVTKDVMPEFIYLACKTAKFLETGKRLMTGAVGQKRVPREYIENLAIALPPLQEQQAIVEKVQKLSVYLAELETAIADSQAHAKQLTRAALNQAFAPTAKSSE